MSMEEVKDLYGSESKKKKRCPDELMHYGVKGMKWGVRRYRNKDGSLTDAGKKRDFKKDLRKLRRAYYKTHEDTSRYLVKADDYYSRYSNKPQNDRKAAKVWKDTYNLHERAVKTSREMRKTEQDFIDKYKDYKISDREVISKGKSYVLAMQDNRVTYAEGAKGGFFNFVFGNNNDGNYPTKHYTVKG